MYSSNQIANFFIKKSHATGIEITPMKLIKLCYVAHGWHLGLYDEELLAEAIYAWKYGPVINSLYTEFKKYHTSPISELYIDRVTGKIPLPDDAKTPFLDKTWDIYKDFSAIQMSTLTHQKNTPWDIIWNQLGGKNRLNVIIPNDLIRDYYKKRIEAVSHERK